MLSGEAINLQKDEFQETKTLGFITVTCAPSIDLRYCLEQDKTFSSITLI